MDGALVGGVDGKDHRKPSSAVSVAVRMAAGGRRKAESRQRWLALFEIFFYASLPHTPLQCTSLTQPSQPAIVVVAWPLYLD